MWRSIVPVTYTVHDTSSCSATVCPILLCCHASMSPCPSCFVWFWIKKFYGSCHVHKMHPVPKYVLKRQRFGQVFCYSEDLYGNLQYSLTSPLTVHTTDSWLQGFHMSCERPKQKEEIDDMVMIPLTEMQVGERTWVIMTSGLGNPGIYGLTNPRKEDTFGLRIQPTTCRCRIHGSKKLLILGPVGDLKCFWLFNGMIFSSKHDNWHISGWWQGIHRKTWDKPSFRCFIRIPLRPSCVSTTSIPTTSPSPLKSAWNSTKFPLGGERAPFAHIHMFDVHESLPWYLPWHLPWYLPCCHVMLSHHVVHICPYLSMICCPPGLEDPGDAYPALARCMATTKAGQREALVKYIGEQWWTMVNNHHWKLVSWESCLSI